MYGESDMAENRKEGVVSFYKNRNIFALYAEKQISMVKKTRKHGGNRQKTEEEFV